MAHATTWSAVVKSPVNQTPSPVSVPVPLDVPNAATMPPSAVTALMFVCPNSESRSSTAFASLPPVGYQYITSGPPPPEPVNTFTGSPAKVSAVPFAPAAIVGQVPLIAGSIVGFSPAELAPELPLLDAAPALEELPVWVELPDEPAPLLAAELELPELPWLEPELTPELPFSFPPPPFDPEVPPSSEPEPELVFVPVFSFPLGSPPVELPAAHAEAHATPRTAKSAKGETRESNSMFVRTTTCLVRENCRQSLPVRRDKQPVIVFRRVIECGSNFPSRLQVEFSSHWSW